jgi:hypothetical protein
MGSITSCSRTDSLNEIQHLQSLSTYGLSLLTSVQFPALICIIYCIVIIFIICIAFGCMTWVMYQEWMQVYENASQDEIKCYVRNAENNEGIV